MMIDSQRRATQVASCPAASTSHWLEVLMVLVLLASASDLQQAAADDSGHTQSLAVLNDVISMTSCPRNCTCTQTAQRPVQNMKINCTGRTDGNSSLIAREIDAFLAAMLSTLTDLTVTNSPLTVVPTSICKLTAMRRLMLYANRIERLPTQCFNNMTQLTEFSAEHNNLVAIEEGIFDGLRSLKLLNLASNQISSIGLHTFTAESGLVSLHDILLDGNRLTQLEPWPFIRGQLVPGSNVSLIGSHVVNFTNSLGWSFRCGSKPGVIMTLDLRWNDYGHFFDLMDGWNITGMINVLCLFGAESHSTLTLLLTLHICDCRDYELYAVVRGFQHVTILDDQYCEVPTELYDKKINSVELWKFVCDVASPPCPVGCTCVKRPSNRTYTVTCPDVHQLPMQLPNASNPQPYNARYVLNLNGSNVAEIDDRDYFNKTHTLVVSHSAVDKVSDDAWRSLVQLEHIDLSSNRLSLLSTVLQSENLTFKSLVLDNNPFRCQCDDRWIRDWMTSLGSGLVRPNSVECHDPERLRGKSILSVTDQQFCYDPLLETLKVAIPTACGTIVLVSCLVAVIYRYRVKMFVHLNIHPFDVDECLDEEMTYDVFVSCANEDRDVGRAIVERLERGDHVDRRGVPQGGGYRVCYHERDFSPGSLITDSIEQAIEHSKRVVCLLTADFLRSTFCMLEFRAAWAHSLRLNKRRLVVIKWPDVDQTVPTTSQRRRLDEALLADDDDDDDVIEQPAADVRMFLSTYTYVDHDKDDWWQQLIYAMPINRLPQLPRFPANLG